jgi:hypothetical protein
VRVGSEHGLRIVAEPGRDDVNRDALRQRERRGGVAKNVECPGRESGRLAEGGELLREPLWVDRSSERVGEDEISVVVGVTAEVAFEPLNVALLA